MIFFTWPQGVPDKHTRTVLHRHVDICSHTHTHAHTHTHTPPYLCVVGAGVRGVESGQPVDLPEQQQLLVEEAHLLLGALAAAQL